MFEIRLVTRQRNWHDMTEEVNSVLCVSIAHWEQLRTWHGILSWCLQSSFSQRHFCLVLIPRQTRTCIDFFCNDKLLLPRNIYSSVPRHNYLYRQIIQMILSKDYDPCQLASPSHFFHWWGITMVRNCAQQAGWALFWSWECRGHLISESGSFSGCVQTSSVGCSW